MNGKEARVISRDDREAVAKASWVGYQQMMRELWPMAELQGLHLVGLGVRPVMAGGCVV